MVTRKISFFDPVIDGGRYYLTPDLVCTKVEGGKIKGEEILYFEGNPYPIGQPDKSKDFLNSVVGENYVRQTSGAKTRRIGINKTVILVAAGVILTVTVAALWYFGFLKVGI